MAKTKKPTHQPSLPFPSAADSLHQEGNWLWIPLRKEWRDVTTKPEEIVRQKFIRTLVEHSAIHWSRWTRSGARSTVTRARVPTS